MAFPIAPSTSPGTSAPYKEERSVLDALEPAAIQVRVDVLLASLEREADRRVGARRTIEQRWVRESFQYHGRYMVHEEKSIKASSNIHRSTVYMNETRRKTDAMEDRIVDIEFPVDDSNYSIMPTSVPQLSDEAMAWARFAAENQQALLQLPEGAPEAAEAMEAQRQALQRATETQAIMDEARRRTESMKNEMDDQLQECGYNHECKKVIHDACKLGTGVMKGPVLAASSKKYWSKRIDPQSGFTVHEMAVEEKPRPVFYRIDPWNWFPDMDATNVKESERFFERHLLTASGLKKLARIDGFIKDNIRRLLKEKARSRAPHYLSELRSIADDRSTADESEKYHVWEYHGPLDMEDMHCLAALSDDSDLIAYAGEIDPLEEIYVTVWFCQGVLLKFGIHPLEDNECIYSVFNYKKDDHSIFGFGIPHLMANQQNILCGAWRSMVDNSNLATLPQILINKSIVEPEDGDMTLYPGKVWIKKSGVAPGEKVFETFHLDIRQAEQAAIIEMTLQAIDREIGVPTIAEMENGAIPTQTAYGFAVLSGEKKIPFRAMIQHFDDNITVPNMQRLFNWNMQFSDNDAIKGDMRIRARGVSTFLLRELQAPALMAMLTQFSAHPILGPALKVMPMARMVAQAMMLPQHEVIKSDEQVAADLKAAEQNQPEEPSPDQIKLQVAETNYRAAIEQAQINAESRKYDVDRQYEIEILRQETALNKNLDNNEAKREIERQKRESAERQQAADIGLAEKMGKPVGGGWA